MKDRCGYTDFYVNEDTTWLGKTIRWTVNVVLVLASAWSLVRGFCTQVPVLGGSMQSVLGADDVVLVNRLIYNVGELERFDIVVFEREDHKKNMKWTIDLPGETVQIKGGYIFIDDELLNAEDDLGQVSPTGRTDALVKLEDNEYFLLGDNRDNSEDSRFLNTGNVKREQMQGKTWFGIFPPLKLDFIHSR